MRTLILFLALILAASCADAQQVFYRKRMKADSLNYGNSLPVGVLRDSIRAAQTGVISALNIATTSTTPAWITHSTTNTNRSTGAQATDTSAFSFAFNARKKPSFTMVGDTGLTWFKVDTLGKVTALTSFTQGSAVVLDADDSTSIRAYSGAIYLKNADSTTLKNALLKNADSTSIRNYSGALYLKNADSTTLKNALLKNADSTSIRDYSTVLYAPKATPTFTGIATFASIKLGLHAIALGDSVFGHTFIDAADSVLKSWNGTAWIEIADLNP